MQAYLLEIQKLSDSILEMIAEGLGLEPGYIKTMSEVKLLTSNFYPPCPDPSLTIGLPAHKDPTLITILYRSDSTGLQILKDGQWVNVGTIQNSFVVNIGNQLEVNKYDKAWKKEWFGAGIFFEGSEQVDVDVFKKLEKRKVLSNVEKAGLLSKAEELGFTLSSIEKLGILSKAEELGLLSLLENVAGYSPASLASAALPVLVAAILAVVLIPDDSTALVVAQAVLAGTFVATATGLFVGSIVLEGLQEAD